MNNDMFAGTVTGKIADDNDCKDAGFVNKTDTEVLSDLLDEFALVSASLKEEIAAKLQDALDDRDFAAIGDIARDLVEVHNKVEDVSYVFENLFGLAE